MKIKEKNVSTSNLVGHNVNEQGAPKQNGRHLKKSKIRENDSTCYAESLNGGTDGKEEEDKMCDSRNKVTNGTEQLKDAFIQDSLIFDGLESLHMNDVCVETISPQVTDPLLPCVECPSSLVCSEDVNMSEEVLNKLSVSNKVPEVIEAQSSVCSIVGSSHETNDSDRHSGMTCEIQNASTEEKHEQHLVPVQNDLGVEEPWNFKENMNQQCSIKEYFFEIPQRLCGLLIGRNGRSVKRISALSEAEVTVIGHPLSCDVKLCRLIGLEEQINRALSLIRQKFPSERFERFYFPSVNMPCVPIADSYRLFLPEAILFDVVLSATVNAGHFFVQQPTHPSYYSLRFLTQEMSTHYGDGSRSPELPDYSKGNVCVVPMSDNSWHRVEIVDVSEDMTECTVKYLDQGGFCRVSSSSLRQIRIDYMGIPFQASECYLGSVTFPHGEETWSDAANDFFTDIAKSQILQGFIIAYSPDRIPYVHLFSFQDNNHTFINRELVKRGMAEWINHVKPSRNTNSADPDAQAQNTKSADSDVPVGNTKSENSAS